MTRDRQAVLPYGRQQISEDDIAAVVAALRSDYLTTGPLVPAFEAALAAELQAQDAVACANGTAALHLAMLTLDIGLDDVVVVPAVTFPATANCARLAGAEVVFADVDPASGLMTAATLEAALLLTPQQRVGAAIPVHLAGHTANMPELADAAQRHGLVVVEDACHALGTRYRRGNEMVNVGACADSVMACFSFHPVKTLTTGEGGAVTTPDPTLARRLRLLRNHGVTRDPDAFELDELARDAGGEVNPWHYEMQVLGLNYRLTDVQCALGLSQLKRLATFADRRRAISRRYDTALSSLAPVVQPLPQPPGEQPVLHLYVLLINFPELGLSRRQFQQRLHEFGIGSQVHYTPVHLHPYYRRRYGEQSLPGAETYFSRCLSIPLHAGMSDADADRVIDALRTIVGQG